MPGKVYLIGAGPGDPELLTCKGRRILEQADAILFDHLAPGALLDLAPLSAERVYVGKKKSDHAFSQEEICDMLIERARRGLRVVRLKGGDPLLFGRGGEEAEALADAGVPFELVPGVTVPLGIGAYAGVPLTHRGRSTSVSFVAGHEIDAVDWKTVGQADTLVIFMGMSAFAEIARELIAAGRSARKRWPSRRAGPRAPIRKAIRRHSRVAAATHRRRRHEASRHYYRRRSGPTAPEA